MKQGKQISTKQRWGRYITYGLLSSVLGGFAGFFGVLIYQNGLPDFMSVDSLLIATRTLNFIVFAVAGFLGFKANRLYSIYETIEEEDEVVVDNLYNQMFRSLEYATILFNIAYSLTLLNMGLGLRLNFDKPEEMMIFSLIDIVLFVCIMITQPLILKLTQRIRHYKLSAFTTVDEMRDFANAMDEGEKQANYEMAFQVMFNLNQIILPGLYIFLLVLNFIFREPQVVGYVIVAFIHIYINAMQYSMIRRYFK